MIVIHPLFSREPFSAGESRPNRPQCQSAKFIFFTPVRVFVDLCVKSFFTAKLAKDKLERKQRETTLSFLRFLLL
jgi:hypothetical protein